jgi:hypothetical protein
MTQTQEIHGFVTANLYRKDGTHIQLAKDVPNTITQDGRDVMISNVYTNVTTGTRGFNYIGLTESTISPAITDTTLAGEIVANGLNRDFGTAVHTDNSNSATVERTFTATGAFTDVKASAVFNAISGVTMGHIANLPTGSGLMQSGDTLKITWTFNLG